MCSRHTLRSSQTGNSPEEKQKQINKYKEEELEKPEKNNFFFFCFTQQGQRSNIACWRRQVMRKVAYVLVGEPIARADEVLGREAVLGERRLLVGHGQKRRCHRLHSSRPNGIIAKALDGDSTKRTWTCIYTSRSPSRGRGRRRARWGRWRAATTF